MVVVEAVAGSTRDVTDRERDGTGAGALSEKKLQQVLAEAPVGRVLFFVASDLVYELANVSYQALLATQQDRRGQ